MAFEIKFTIDAKALGQKLSKLDGLLARREFLLQEIGSAQVEWIKENFARYGALGGKPWKPNAPSTVAAKGHGHVLFATGDLANSFRYTYVANRVTVRTDNPVAKFHEFGTKGPYDIPKNPPMPPGHWLSFIGSDGSRVFSKHVRHPGLPARPMLPSPEIALQVAKEAAERYVDAMIKAEDQIGAVSRAQSLKAVARSYQSRFK
jgi:phage gpG-like protein